MPDDSRAVKDGRYLKPAQISDEKISKAKQLNTIAGERGQSLAQMAIAWLLKDPRVTSVLIGASKPSQIDDNVAALNNIQFSEDELAAIEAILKD